MFAGLTTIQQQTTILLSIIKSLLQIARAGSEPRIRHEIFPLSACIAEIQQMQPNQRLHCQIDPAILVRGNREFYSIIFSNLTDNALKYSGEGEIVTITAFQDEQQVTISVADTGIGMTPHDKENAFKRFYRSSRAEEQGIRGYGLGLSLVLALTQALHGTIAIEDNKPRGTILRLSFPTVHAD